MPQVMMIAYFFPPLGGAGVQRATKFVKYLPLYGWDPVVLTVKEGTHIAYDHTLMNELPKHLPVYRSWAFDPEDLRGWWRWFRGRKDEAGPKLSTVDPEPDTVVAADTHSSSWKARMAHLYLGALPWVCVPDRKIGWLPYARRMGGQVCADRPIRILFSTSSPITSHLIALKLKRRYGIPWVADFRDLWIDFPGYKPITRLHGLIERRIERAIITQADRVIANTGAAREVMLRAYPYVDPDRVVTIPNGYDEEDFATLPEESSGHIFTMTYTGTFYGARNPKNLMRALSLLFTRHPEIRGAIAIRFIGSQDTAVETWVREQKLQDTIELLPYEPHGKSLEALSLSNAMLLIDAPGFIVNIPGKVFEYLRIGRPILALAPPDGATAELLRQTGGAVIVPPEDVSGIGDALYRLYMAQNHPAPDPGTVARFERRRLTARLAEVFDQVHGAQD